MGKTASADAAAAAATATATAALATLQGPVMADLDSRAASIAAALVEFAPSLLVHSQDLLLLDVWSTLPPEWQSYLLTDLGYCDLACLASDPSVAERSPPPASLARVLALRDLGLPRKPQSSVDGDTEKPLVGVLRPSKNSRKVKKTHEIERLADLIESVAGSAGCARVLDVGCGKGSLAARLSRGLDVVGLDAQADLTAAATAAAAALDGKVRVWQRTIAADAHAAAVLDGVREEAWPNPAAADAAGGGAVLVTALHACGDLSPTLLRAFVDGSGGLRALALVPCCYNLLTVAGEAEHCPLKQDALKREAAAAAAAPAPPPPPPPAGSALETDAPTRGTVLRCEPCDEPCDVDGRAVLRSRSALPPSSSTVNALSSARVRAESARVPAEAKRAADVNGFPLSAAMRQSGLRLPRDARMAAVQREAAGLPPAWLQEAIQLREANQGSESAAPAAMVQVLHVALLAIVIHRRFADIVPAGTRFSSGGHRKHREEPPRPLVLMGQEAEQASAEAQGGGRGRGGGSGGSRGGGHEFAEFAQTVLSHLGLPTGRMSAQDLASFAEAHVAEAGGFGLAAKRLAAIYSLRAVLAPLVESAVLYDQLLFLQEHGVRCAAVPVFEPSRSPRNVAIVAVKESPPLCSSPPGGS